MEANDLRSYISSHKNIFVLRNKQFRDSKLVIDGCNLYHTLYFTSGLDQAQGGEYGDFETVVCNFFKNLKECSIKPYVVLDGGDDGGDGEFRNLKKKGEITIRKAHALSTGRPRNVLPILVKTVFVQILRKLEVPFVQCVAKADWETAALANEWNCPVLSNKADFYIFDMKGGLLPLWSFQWKNLSLMNQSDEKFVRAKEYFVERLSTHRRLFLPVFATIASNDDIHLDKGSLPNWAKPSKGSTVTKDIDALFKWLSKFKKPKEAINGVLSHIRDPAYSDKVLNVLTQGLEDYQLSLSSIAEFFTSGTALPDSSPCLPEWTLQQLAKGKLDTVVMDVLVKQRTVLSFPVENSLYSSSNRMSQPIRQTIYALLLGVTDGAYVEEYDREELEITSSRVEAVLPSKVVPNLQLETLWETAWNWRQQILLEALLVSQPPDRLPVPPSLQLAVYVTCYWLKQAEPEPKPEFLRALLVGLVYGELSRDPLTQRGAVPKRLKNLKTRKEKIPLDLEVAHAYSQWQCSLRDSLRLNQLLANPVPEPEYAWLYSGELVHSVIRDLRRGVGAEVLLAGSPPALQLFQQLMEAVEPELDDEMRARLGWSAGGSAGSAPALQFYQQLMEAVEPELDDEMRSEKSKSSNLEEKIYEQSCSFRTRQRKRSHKSDPRSKKSDLSHWE
ncbi:protein asteroid homolog 1 [Astyanax mexicanus]|uniref:protein asteroid homolog 1 n=1 Tax=Astyanax mexicanus TaxID=7994 RepID=UPI0020CB223B|nr:protein asteroid homolog 1 [Astyanax mexicanus]XP_049324946.1 protein asteroid homolog 1 [Astyanax mexicanus]